MAWLGAVRLSPRQQRAELALSFLLLAVPGDQMREPTFLSRAPLSFEIQLFIVLLHELKATSVQKCVRTERRK